MSKNSLKTRLAAAFTAFALFLTIAAKASVAVSAAGDTGDGESYDFISDAAVTAQNSLDEYSLYGGGYSATGQIPGVSYTAKLYTAEKGLPTSDAMFLLGASDGHVWIGGYSGIIKYDGTEFTRLDTSDGLTSARAFFEDSLGRIWVGTNDNGVVILDGEKRTWLTYDDGLPSSSTREFAEDNAGNIFVGTTAGVCYIDKNMQIHTSVDERLADERVLKMDSDSTGRIYGQTSSGIVFAIDDCAVSELYTSEELGLGKITSLAADPYNNGKLYFGTEGSNLFYGDFGLNAKALKRISVSPLEGVHWLSYDCGRVWVASRSIVGYIGDEGHFHALRNIPMDNNIEMMTSDYQGNMWVASSTQGVMKIVTNNFMDLTYEAGMEEAAVNVTCLIKGNIYTGTDEGLKIIGKNIGQVKNSITSFVGETRVRDIERDLLGNTWICTYSNEKGLICVLPDNTITSYTVENGLPHNQVRCIAFSPDGTAVAGTNDGIALIKDGEVVKTFTAKDGIKNSLIQTIFVDDSGIIFAGSDGGGIYVIEGDKVSHLGRDDGLTSDVIVRIMRDDRRGVCWILTSNSIEYMKDGEIIPITTFPYNNNYDIAFDDKDNAWVLSSYGVYVVNANLMLRNEISDYRLYTVENGLPYGIMAYSFATKDYTGNLYIPGRNGVIKVNINDYYEENEKVKTGISSVVCDDKEVPRSEDGSYRIPASDGRIQISASVMDYTMLNPLVRVFLEGGQDGGITVLRSKLSPLEFTNLKYGNYTLHIQILDTRTGDILQDDTYTIIKEAKFTELFLFRMIMALIVIGILGLLIWRISTHSVVQKQYAEILKARDEAEQANKAKSRFLANISHEIRTPINTIMGMNEMVLREDSTGVPKGYFMSMMNYAFDIRNASESLLGLINNLLDISKIESGKMHLVEQEYDTQEMLRSIVSMIRVRSTQKELTFDVIVDEILPKRLYGDSGKIKQIVLNLLTNAVKYTDSGGFALIVSMDEREDDIAGLRFSVKDTGIGVKAEDMEKLFTAYERLEEEKNANIQGTGLGLDISRRFAELMEGKLWCESIYGEGSEFILTVKQRIVDNTPLGAFMEHDENSPKGPYIPKFIAPDADILVVDDNPMNLSVMKGLLKATKVYVTTASSGEDALDKIKDSSFDVVLLDHMMPGMDGIETLQKIRELEPDLPVYALTANSIAGEEFYLSKGFNGYLEKPVDTEILEKTIMRHLPEEKMEKPTNDYVVEEITEMPETMQWIYSTEGIDVEEGIKNSGGIASYIFALELFLETIDGNSKALNDALENGNIRLYTIKIHALKSSARIIGAKALSELAFKLEEAGNKSDTDFIDENNDKFMVEYLAYKEKLAKLKQGDTKEEEEKEEISPEELADAYAALSDVVPQMDYDAVEMILEQLSHYKLPEEDEKKMKELETMMKNFDWDNMEELVKSL
ncbi:hybrid sensor histidine kinase/response regulator [Butyrivibrio sp. AD3002]|uniref:hybrid sensor histidine kinase/response regulator n=1 Tax=Butyrivibrio sp. AD3002 TaxID=1280670 RepID=UPI0003B72857|nr:response regulator [Butyrivibrio sp. AD3002]